MICVVIGASQDAVHAIKKAKELGVYVMALDGNPNAAGFEYADKSLVIDISDVEKICCEVGRIKPNFIIPVPIGKFLSTIGYVNEKLQLPGIKYEATNNSTDKYLFHNKIKHIRPVKIYLLNKDMNIDDLSVRYPAIMKPRFGSGSRDVFYITDHQELQSACNYVKSKEEDYILEEAVEGTEYGVDGVVIQGKLTIVLIRKKTLTPLPVRQAVAYISIPKIGHYRKMYHNVSEYLKLATECLSYQDCMIHADIIIKDEKIFLIEIAPRPAGHNLYAEFIPNATGIDMIGEYMKCLQGKQGHFESEHIRNMQIHYFDFENVTIKKIPDIRELKENKNCNLVTWNCNIGQGQYMEKVIDGHSIMDRGYFIVEGKDEEDMIKQSQWILSQFEKGGK